MLLRVHPRPRSTDARCLCRSHFRRYTSSEIDVRRDTAVVGVKHDSMVRHAGVAEYITDATVVELCEAVGLVQKQMTQP